MDRATGVKRFHEFLSTPLFPKARIILALLVIPLSIAVTQPMWTIRMAAPQYPDGLSLVIYAHTIEGGHNGADLKEINLLNHYIGMKSLARADMSDLDWIPFALGFMVILCLRCAAIGTVRSLIDIVVITGYVTAFALGRFVYRLYTYGHTLNPDAPVRIPGFTPVIFGTKQVANFMTSSYPALGTILVGIYGCGITALVLWHLVSGRQRALVLGTIPPAPPLEAEPASAASL